MSVVARRIAATPKRTATETWQVIIDLVSSSSSEAKKILESIVGVVSAIIVDEITAGTPIVFIGTGPRIRIYCVYGEDALSEDNCNEESLIQRPTDGDWHMYLPCTQEDLAWVTESLKSVSNFITSYDKDKEPDIKDGSKVAESLTVDTNSFLNKL